MKEELKTLNKLVDAVLEIEKLRVSSQVRGTHLRKKGRRDPETEELHRRLKDLEDYIDGRIAQILESHPAYHWFSRVKGVGKENIAKIVALIDIEKARTISSLWKYAGYSVEDGRAPKRQKGEKLCYNSRLRTLCWRLGMSLLKAGVRQECPGCRAVFGEEKIRKSGGRCPDCGAAGFRPVAVSKYAGYYLDEKEKYQRRFLSQGYEIVPAERLPKKDGKRYEPSGMISEGHIHSMALRKMIKLFLACLWLVWREAEGLPLTAPFAVAREGHSLISPWEMIDG